MEEFRYNQGQVIFREGDESDVAYQISGGSVEIRLGPDSDPQILAVLKPGEILGEMALVSDHPRSATAIAREDTQLIVLSEAYFQKEVVGNPKMVRSLIATLVERLRNADALIRATPGQSQGESDWAISNEALLTSPGKSHNSETSSDVPTIVLESDYEPHLDVQPFEVSVTAFPFRIGRYFQSHDGLFFSHADLVIEDAAPFQVSRVHCDLLCKNGQVFIKDRGSRLGTIVNGERIGARSGQIKAELEPGSNEIILGNPAKSPHRLKVVVGA